MEAQGGRVLSVMTGGRQRTVWKQVVGSVVASTTVLSNISLLGFGSILLAQLDEPGSSLVITGQPRAWLMGGAFVGTLLGCVLAAFFAKRLGPSRIMLWHTIPNALGWVLQAVAHGFWPLIVGRFLCGVACGICISACMIYISETTCPRIRGVMLLLPETFATGGLLMCYVLGLLLHWRYVAIVCGALPNIIIFTGFWWLPESPTWLVHQFRLEDAANALRFFRGEAFDAEGQVQELVIGMEKTKMTSWQAFRLLRYAEYLRPTVIVIVQMTILNFSGFNAMFGYAVVIFRLANTGINEYHCAILLAGVRLASVIVSWSLIDRLGRRVLLSLSGAVCALSLATIGGFFYARVHAVDAAAQMAWLPLVGMMSFICSFAVGTGPVSWVVFAELLPSAVRELCGSITIIIWALTQFVILQMFPALRNVLDNHGTFWLFAGVCLFQLVFAVFMVPETRRRTLEDIHREHFSVKERKSMQDSKPDGAESEVKSQV